MARIYDYFDGFGIKNFRAIRDSFFFEIKPITILVGPNNSGKSSLIKALDMVQENLKKNKLTELIPSTKEEDLISYKSILNSNSKSEHIDILIKLNTKGPAFDKYFSIFSSKTVDIHYTFVKKDNIGFLSKIEVKTDNNNIPFIYINNLASKKINIKCDLSFFCNSIQNNPPNFVDKIDFTGFKPIEKKDDMIKFQVGDSILDTSKLNFISVKQQSILNSAALDFFSELTIPHDYLDPLIIDFYDMDPFVIIKKMYFDFGNRIRISISDLYSQYINEKFQETDHFVCEPEIILQDVLTDKFKSFSEEFLASTLLKIFTDHVPASFRLNHLNVKKFSSSRLITTNEDKEFSLLRRIYQNENKKYLEFVDKWIGKNGFGIAESIEIEYLGEYNAFSVKMKVKKKSFHVKDTGYGVNQLLAMLLHLSTYYSDPWKGISSNLPLLAIEEPESNLHPRFQSLLADLFLDCINSLSVKLLIETHSEYLVRKLQYLTASGKANPEDIIIYYFEEPSEKSKSVTNIRAIRILPDGTLTGEFGPGFFDEAINLKLDLLRLKNTSKN